MIGTALLSLPLAALVAYGLLEARRARIVGLSIAGLAVATLALAWVPGLAAGVAAMLGPGTAADLVLLSWVGLSSLVLLNVHLKLRRQMQVVTALARRIAIAGEPPVASTDAARADVTAAAPPVATPASATPSLAELETIIEIKPLAPRPVGDPVAAFLDAADPEAEGALDAERVPDERAAGGVRR